MTATITRDYLEAKQNWVATFAVVQRPGRFMCLMRTVQDGFYWHQPDYNGTYGWGATMSYSGHESLRHSIQDGMLSLIHGTLPWALKGGDEE